MARSSRSVTSSPIRFFPEKSSACLLAITYYVAFSAWLTTAANSWQNIPACLMEQICHWGYKWGRSFTYFWRNLRTSLCAYLNAVLWSDKVNNLNFPKFGSFSREKLVQNRPQICEICNTRPNFRQLDTVTLRTTKSVLCRLRIFFKWTE